jgi:hypothetical protein
MTTIKNILSENRESVISSIKWVFKVWKSEDVKIKMIEFLAYAEEKANVENLSTSKKVKSDLKTLVQKMAISQKHKSTDNRKSYEIKEDIADARGLVVNKLTGEFEDINGKIVNIHKY